MADLKKRGIGEPFRPSIAEQHALVDLANDRDQARHVQRARTRPLDLVRVKNESGAARSQWDVLGIHLDETLITATENSQDLLDQRFVFRGKTPVWPDHIGRWALLIEEIGSNEIGWAAVGGIIAAQINVNHLEHDLADIIDTGGNGRLESGWHGAAEILVVEQTVGSSKWALLRLGNYESPAIKGVADASGITDDLSGNVDVWRAGAVTSPLATETVWLDWMHGGNDLPGSKEVLFRMFRDQGKFCVIEREC